jgi:DNA-binding transcriptional LysR family regulator
MTATPPPLARVDLNLLVALDALLRERSVTAAGHSLALTQPSMSAALARLRVVFGDELLVRRGRAMHLTPLAESLEVPIREILGRIEATVLADRGFDPRHGARVFTISATDYAALVLLRPLLLALATEAPNVQVRVQALRVAEIGPRLSVDDVDLAIVPARFSAGSGLPFEPLFTDRFVAATWAGNADVTAPLTIGQMRSLPYLSFRQGDVPTMVDRRLEELDCRLAPQIQLESFVVGANFLRGTRFVTFLQERLVDDLAGDARLRMLEPPVELPTVIETMAWHPRWTTDPAHQWLRERILQLAAAL